MSSLAFRTLVLTAYINLVRDNHSVGTFQPLAALFVVRSNFEST